jgi:hypothetical protein
MPKFLSPEVLLAGVAEVASLAKQERIRVVLVGGLAMQHYGSDRLTGDLDFAAAEALRSLAVIRPLTFGGVQATTPGGVPVEIIVRDDDYQALYEEVVALSPLVRELGVRVARPEHLVALKMAAARDKDVLDMKFLLGVEGLVDGGKARAIVRRHLGPYAAQEFDRVVDEVAWERQTGRR